MFYWSIPVILLFLLFMLNAPADDGGGACSSSAPAFQSIPAILSSSGSVEKLDLSDQSSISITIFAEDENNGGQVDMRRELGPLMRGLHQVAQCFPKVRFINADLLSPGEAEHDEHGNTLGGFEVPVVSLMIRTTDLLAFKEDFDWDSYPVYAANRYARTISLSFSDAWHRELVREEEKGNFVNSL